MHTAIPCGKHEPSSTCLHACPLPRLDLLLAGSAECTASSHSRRKALPLVARTGLHVHDPADPPSLPGCMHGQPPAFSMPTDSLRRATCLQQQPLHPATNVHIHGHTYPPRPSIHWEERLTTHSPAFSNTAPLPRTFSHTWPHTSSLAIHSRRRATHHSLTFTCTNHTLHHATPRTFAGEWNSNHDRAVLIVSGWSQGGYFFLKLQWAWIGWLWVGNCSDGR